MVVSINCQPTWISNHPKTNLRACIWEVIKFAGEVCLGCVGRGCFLGYIGLCEWRRKDTEAQMLCSLLPIMGRTWPVSSRSHCLYFLTLVSYLPRTVFRINPPFLNPLLSASLSHQWERNEDTVSQVSWVLSFPECVFIVLCVVLSAVNTGMGWEPIRHGPQLARIWLGIYLFCLYCSQVPLHYSWS